MQPSKLLLTALLALAVLAPLAGCDAQRISELQPGVSTEVEVRDRFGIPENTWNEADGSRTLEYNRQPAGTENFHINLGPDGKLVAVHQVLNVANFAKVRPGMGMDEVRRLLGKPAKTTRFDLTGETHVDWRFQADPNTRKLFTVIHKGDGKVLSTQVGLDTLASENLGGGR